MNLSILLKVLDSLGPITDQFQDRNGQPQVIGAMAISLKQALEVLANTPDATNPVSNRQQLEMLIWKATAQDPQVFDGCCTFVAACMTGGQRQNANQAMQSFGQYVSRVATQ